MTPGLVSIVVTSYNHAEFLPQRMESLLAQTYRPIEIIVVDDHSTDDSVEVLRRWEAEPLVRVVALDANLGVAGASNRGAALARGEYLMFAECDDFDAPAHVERLVRALESSSAGVAFCRSALVDSRGTVVGDDFAGREPAFRAHCAADARIPSPLMRRFLLRACVVPNMSAALMRKAAFDAAGGASSAYRLCLDWDLWSRLALRNDFYYAAETLSSFRTHATTARSTFGLAMQIGEIFDVLRDAAAAMELSARDRFKFRLGLGLVWAGYFRADPGAWLRGFPRAAVAASSRDPLAVLFLLMAVCAKLLGIRYSLVDRHFRV